MTTKEKARPGLRKPGRVGETAFGEAVTPTKNCTTEGQAASRRISDFLLDGQGSALTISDLRRLTGLDSRVIRRQIEQERRGGCPIVSDCQRGYWLAETQAEIETFCHSMRRRAREILRTARAVERGVERWDVLE